MADYSTDTYFTYKDIIFVKNNPTHYLIICFTNEYHCPSRSIIFQMEPWVYDNNKNWGIKKWSKYWSLPDPKRYLYVLRHVNEINPAQWFNKSENLCKNKKDRVIAIISWKVLDSGHYNRINFIKYVENLGIDIIDIYGRENYHSFKGYKGTIKDKSIINEYKYLLSAENNNEYNYATEKIWEAFINYSLCFYDGCPNLHNYVSNMSYIPINLNEYYTACNLILNSINNNLWEKRLPYIIKARQKTIENFNLLEKVYKILSKK
jgi:hypothetical protein